MEMLEACRALKDLRRAASAEDSPSRAGEPETPCWPKRMVLTCEPSFATTTCDFVGWEGVRFGLLTPERLRRLSRVEMSRGIVVFG